MSHIDNKIAEIISRQTNVSKSTVSKALNNCGGVDPQTKEAILKTARELQYTPIQKIRMGIKKTDWTIGVVIPANPQYFWGDVIEGIKNGALQYPDIQVVFSLFSNLLSEQDTLYCLEYMQDLHVDLLIVTPPASSIIHRKLDEIALTTPIVCLSETAEIPFIFYVGANFYQDGVLLARASAQILQKHANILHINHVSLPMVKQRDDGFYKETASLVPHVKWVGDVQTDQLPVSVFSAQLARILHEQYNGLFQSVYVSQGHLPQVCLALNKLKLSERIAVFGYENPKQNNAYIKNGMIAAYIEQDTYRQGSCCIDAAYAYLTKGMLPDNRRLYVPSHLYQPAIQSDSETYL